MSYELLLPAGDLNRLKFAIMYGADAVYIGGQNYSLRANANNFSLDEIREGVEFAHERGKKVYVTVNMIFHNDDLNGLDKYLIDLDSIGIDSFIVSDMAVIEAIKRLKLKTKFFISTQKSITNLEAVKFYKSLGAYRVVLARECSREDIKRIKENIDTEVEVFIHGAMCTSYSGRCVMSNYVTLRDSNRGGCSQVCRFTFDNDTSYDYAQFYDGEVGVEGQYFNGRQEISNQDFLGLVLSYDNETGEAVVEQRNKFSVGDYIEVFGPNTSTKKFKVEYIINKDQERVDSASHAQEIVRIKVPFKVYPNDILRVIIS